MTDFLIGRQQILDRHLDTFAYEILFRGKDFDLSLKDGAANATNQVITDTLLEIGLNELVGPHKAFINFTTQNILDKTPLHLPKERIVIEVLESVAIDDNIVANLKELSQLGYTIALDDFVLSPEWLPLLEFADIIKLDVMADGLEGTRHLIEQLKPYKLKLLAEKVETHQEFETLREWGCELFQGFFFSKPNIVEGKRLGVSQTAAIQLLSTVNKADASFAEIGKIISQDVGMSFKLLHYLNSAFFGLPQKVESIQHAIACLGLIEIKRWVNILTLSSMSEKPPSVLQNVLIRAKMCELIAREIKDDQEHYFLIGMLSGLDSLLDMPVTKVMEQLPLAEDIDNAVLNYRGKAGEALQFCIAYERWEPGLTTFRDISPERIANIYLESIDWWATRILPFLAA
ncbi:Predicted signal transduction protein [Methylomonas albis]|uniref:HDOD domain-containing protein n=1 Tax=Methylomonas albis TaxID=1854563 RepID=A0ABR9D2B0_9GAMM|nr:HDOD domain-containing protein [Methylomonas albis]MBD9357227.1 HDOD domain-containing protein [Methylomonas albis]CAD6880456.1 Predicted signal transduction protein [Methylomonas albis]